MGVVCNLHGKESYRKLASKEVSHRVFVQPELESVSVVILAARELDAEINGDLSLGVPAQRRLAVALRDGRSTLSDYFFDGHGQVRPSGSDAFQRASVRAFVRSTCGVCKVGSPLGGSSVACVCASWAALF